MKVVMDPVFQNAEMAVLALLILIGLAILNLINFVYQRRQAQALEEMEAATKAAYYNQVRKDRSERDAQALQETGEEWIARQIREQTGLTFEFDRTFTLRSCPVFAAQMGQDGFVVVSPAPRKKLLGFLQDVVRQRGRIVGEALEEQDVLGMLKQARREFSRSMIAAGEFFDIEAHKAGEDLAVAWRYPAELYFTLQMPKH
jgi:HAMP domain-containing protein